MLHEVFWLSCNLKHAQCFSPEALHLATATSIFSNVCIITLEMAGGLTVYGPDRNISTIINMTFSFCIDMSKQPLKWDLVQICTSPLEWILIADMTLQWHYNVIYLSCKISQHIETHRLPWRARGWNHPT